MWANEKATAKLPPVSKTELQSDRSDTAVDDLGVNLGNALVWAEGSQSGFNRSHHPSHLLHIIDTQDLHLY